MINRITGNGDMIQGLLLIIAVALLLFTPLMLQVWKEGEVVYYARVRDENQDTLDGLKDECATLQVSIQGLSGVQRLTTYGRDSLGLLAPQPEQVVVVRRKASGQLIEKKVGLWVRLKRWVRGS